MEPDVHVLASAQARVQGTYAGDHALGPGQSPRGRKRVPGRGERGTPSYCASLIMPCAY